MAEEEKIVKKEKALPEDYVLTHDFPMSKPFPEGEYDFTVTECVMRRFPETDKAEECRGAAVNLKVTVEGDKKPHNAKAWFRFLPSNESRICEFLRAIGVKKLGEPYDLGSFSDCEGKSGRAYFIVSPDGKYNWVRYFIDNSPRTVGANDSESDTRPLTPEELKQLDELTDWLENDKD